MKSRDEMLRQLFAAAKAAPVEAPEPVSSHLQTRVLAHWRAGAAGHDSWAGLAAVLRGALVCAGVAMMLCVAWSYSELTDVHDNDVAISNYELRADLMP
jgi:hypothetical protein